MVPGEAVATRRDLLPLPSIAAALLAGLLSGCVTSGTRVQATVSSAPPRCEARDAGRPGAPQPLAGASVSMSCPQVYKAISASPFGTTDARGQLDFEEPPFGRWIHDGCELLVKRPGFETKRLPVADVCVEYSSNHCVRAVVTAELIRSAAHAAPCP
jgi:hypothetical protein